MTLSISRRRAITTSAIAVLAALMPWRAPQLSDPLASKPRASKPLASKPLAPDLFAGDPLAHDTVGIFRDRSAAAAIGDAYLAQHPEDRNAPRLLRRLFGDDPAHATAGIGRQDLHARLRRQLRQDFAEGRTVLVDGWLLAETEARLCALAALA